MKIKRCQSCGHVLPVDMAHLDFCSDDCWDFWIDVRDLASYVRTYESQEDEYA